jgi:hypothetical protein
MADKFVDYSQIINDAKAALETGNLGIKAVFTNAGDRDFVIEHMPMVDLRWKRALPEPLAGRNDYVQGVLEVEVATFDLTNRDKAAKLRDDLTSAIQRFFQVNPRFSGSLDTVTIGATDFETGENLGEQGAFAASAVTEINVFLYVNG